MIIGKQGDWSRLAARFPSGWRVPILVLTFAVSSFGLGAPAHAQSPCTGAAGERMVGMTQSGSGVAGTPLCVNDGAGSSNGAPSRPRFKEPPPPKGWEPRFGAQISYPTWVSINERDASKRFGYALAVNYPSEAAARKAVMEHCLRDVMPGEEESCSGGGISTITKAYFRILINRPRGFGMDDFPRLQPLIDARETFAIGNGEYVACDETARSTDGCLNAIFGLGRNGIHQQPLEKEAQAFVVCPAGPTSADQKIVGSDAASGTPVPLCGPDWDVIEPRLHADRYDGFAVHPLLKGPPFASGGHTSSASAERAALALCTEVFGAGCRPFGTHVNGYSAIAANDRGEMFLGKGADKSGAIGDAHQRCDTSPGQIIPCRVLSLRMAGSNYDESATLYSNSTNFGAIAAPGGKVAQSGKAWFSRGMPSLEEAERYALQHCAQANPSGPRCQIMASGVGVLLTSWVGLDGSAGVFTSLDSYSFGDGNHERRDEIVKAICAARGTLCKWNDSYSTQFMQPDLSTLKIGTFASN